MRRARGVVMLVALALVGSATARAEDPRVQAKAAIVRARGLHKAGRFADALQELMTAYALDPQRDLLYGIAQLHVKLGQCPDAITFYRRYLTTHPDAAATAKAQQAIAGCEKVVAATAPPEPPPRPPPPPPPPPQPVVVTPQPPPVPPPPIVVHRGHWYQDHVGGAIVGTGLAAGVVGLVLYRSAVSTRDGADVQTTYPAYVDAIDHAHRTRTYAVIAGATGATLVTAGLLHLVLRDDREGARRNVVIAPISNGAVVTWGSAF